MAGFIGFSHQFPVFKLGSIFDTSRDLHKVTAAIPKISQK